MAQSTHNRTYSPEHYTPAEIVDVFRAAVGTFDLDAASSRYANAVVKATRYYSLNERGEDGSVLPWTGSVFVNPPGDSSGNLVKSFWARAVDHAATDDGVVSWVGFNLDQIAPLQDTRCPLAYPSSILRRRIRFDTLALPGDELSLWKRAETDVDKTLRTTWIAEAMQRDDLVRIPSGSPSRQNYLTLLGGSDEQNQRFVEAAKGLGYVVWQR
jgi:hypothetical protein